MNRLVVCRRLGIAAAQAILMAAAYWLSYALRFDFKIDARDYAILWLTLPLVFSVKLLYFSVFGLMQGWWCYVGLYEMLDLTKAAVASCVTNMLLLNLIWGATGYSHGVFIIDLLLTLILIGGARFGVRAYSEMVLRNSSQNKAIIVGAGQAGTNLVKQLRVNPQLDLNPVGFLDDDPSKHGIRIDGIKVLGPTSILNEAVEQTDARCVVIAMPSASGGQIRTIVDDCRASKVAFKILPAIDQRLNGHSGCPIRDIRPADLLDRTPVRLDMDAIRTRLSDKVIFITGAGGSIGSQLVREVAAFEPSLLLLFDRSENDLFKLSLECSVRFPRLNFKTIVGDILDVSLLCDVFATHQPEVVFHAAAYKHVPLMEQHCFQAVTNNVFGTYNVAHVASRYGTSTFVMISSDKAVRPTNIMGVTKRIAELIVLAMRDQQTRFSVVRFGNVLGSNGSVLPIFQEQIASGGPVTITHPEMRRFFMTIPEAAQLVLQAAALAEKNETFVLDMGEQIRILDLAKRLIRLSDHGLHHIDIIFTGLRPGEKLYEELTLETEQLRPTSHEKIRAIISKPVSLETLLRGLDDLMTAVDTKNVTQLITALQFLVHEYTPSEHVIALSQLDCCDRMTDYHREHVSLRTETLATATALTMLSSVGAPADD